MIKQFKQMRDMMQKMSKGNFSGMEGLLGDGISGKLAKMSMNRMVRKNKNVNYNVCVSGANRR